jgi:hypothetical protein
MLIWEGNRGPPNERPRIKKLLDRDDAFFSRKWVRVTTITLPAAMSVLEFARQSPGWGLLFGAFAILALWELVLRR